MNIRKCANCEYYHRYECRRKSPQAFTTDLNRTECGKAAYWPRVDANDWCGEFEPKKEVTP